MKANKQRSNSRAWKCFFPFVLFLLTISAPAQKTVTGKIIDATTSKPVSGISVQVKGVSNSGGITDESGNFSVRVPASATDLEITGVGYASQTVTISGKTNLGTISLQPTSGELDQVVVIGYGTQRKKDITGSVSSINAATIEKVPVTSLDQSMQGRAAGVQIVNNDGSPGANMSVLIRGVGSLAGGGNNPLYIVDGYPVTGGINNLNPNDIATIDVLKDASATAIYGIRAANGVVVVTTKRGKKDGSATLSLDGFNSVQTRPKKYKILNAQQWGTLASEVAAADNNFSALPNWLDPSSLTEADWQNAIYRPGLTQNYTLGIRGGTDKIQTAASFGYYNQKGIVTGSFFKRYTVGLNLDYTPLKWLKSSTSAKYSYQTSNNPFGTGSLIQLSQLPPTLDGGNKLTNEIKDANGNYGFYNPLNTYVAKYGNPLYSIETNQYSNVTNYLLLTTSLEATIIDGLRLKTNVGINTNHYSGSYYQPEDDRLNDQYNLGGPTTNALYSQHLNQSFEWLWENTLSYDKKFGEHSIQVVGGLSAQKNTYNAMGGQGIPPNATIRDLAQVTNLQLDPGGNGQTVYSLASEFARLIYNYAGKYMITGTVRRDGSSKFDIGHKYGVFPSGAVAWRAKQEDFLKNVSWITDLKFRGSYGMVGNEGSIGLFQYQQLFSTGGAANVNPNNYGYPFDKIYQRGIAQIQPANPNLKWETDYQTDIGMDAAFLNGDLSVTIDWFNRKSKDFLLNIAAPAQTGFLTLTENVGSMDNKGLELAINYNHAASKDIHYGVGLTFTAIKNKLTGIISGTNFVDNFGGVALAGIGWENFTKTYVGQPIGEFYGYKSIGIIQTQAQIDALNQSAAAKNPDNPYYQQPATGPGDRLFADVNGSGNVTPDDQISLGSPLPKFYGGLNLDFSYKAFDFNVYFYGTYGNKILNYQKSSMQSFQNRSFVGVQNVSEEYYNNRWTATNPSNIYSRVTYNDDAIGSNLPSSAWIEDGSFLKLKNFSAGYTLPENITKRVSISRLRIYVSAQNLFVFTKYSGADPEIGIQSSNATQNGIDNGTYPSSRYFTFGLNVTF
ncbi:MAG: TonB-dependent receptor [Chitinophagaceae bacterium]|jgi:TonB-linked SusC/RagA family outer membrane protein|nr:TonB-dependent receptor [Chitinophagaceae bacterium]